MFFRIVSLQIMTVHKLKNGISSDLKQPICNMALVSDITHVVLRLFVYCSSLHDYVAQHVAQYIFFLSFILAWNPSCCHKGCAFLAAAWLAQTENINNFTMCKHLLLATNARRWVSNAGHHFCFVWFGMAMLAQPFCRLHCRSHTRLFYRPAYSSCD